MLTSEDVEAALTELNARDLHQYDSALRRDVYKQCNYCDAIKKLTESKGRSNTLLIHK